jgi:hypothetical protein
MSRRVLVFTFIEISGKAPLECGQIEEATAPIALQTMGDWIVAHTSGRARN